MSGAVEPINGDYDQFEVPNWTTYVRYTSSSPALEGCELLYFRCSDAGRYGLGTDGMTSFLIRRNGVSLYESYGAGFFDTGHWLSLTGNPAPTVTFVLGA